MAYMISVCLIYKKLPNCFERGYTILLSYHQYMRGTIATHYLQKLVLAVWSAQPTVNLRNAEHAREYFNGRFQENSNLLKIVQKIKHSILQTLKEM